MLIIGLLLFAGAATIGIDIAVTNSDAIDVDVFGSSIRTNVGSVVLAGAALALVTLLGAMLLVSSWKRRRRARAAARELQDERDRLTATVEEERTARENAEARARAAMAQATKAPGPAPAPSAAEAESLDLRAGRV